MDKYPAGTAAIDRTLSLFEALVLDDGQRPLSTIASQLGLPPSTARRMAALLVRRGLIAPARRGHYAAGLKLIDLGACSDTNRILADTARPLLRQLAQDARAIAHLGVWDGEMVTYLVKESGGGAKLFSQEGGQLEAYCSAIGKVLLANLDTQRREAYLSAGPFVALTKKTVTDPHRIGEMLLRVTESGFALDSQEIADGLSCVALPIRNSHGNVICAISLSLFHDDDFDTPPSKMKECAAAIERRLGSPPN